MPKKKLLLKEIHVKSFATLSESETKQLEGGTNCRACVSGAFCSAPDHCTGCGGC